MMEPGNTLSQRSSFESIVSDDSRTQTAHLGSARALLRGAPDAALEKPDRRRTPGPRRVAGADHDDGVLVVKGLRVGRRAILCGVALSFLTLLLLFFGIPTALARLLYKDSPYAEKPDPIACHSHNDYWRKEPLFSALKTGCIGIEADVWFVDGDLWVGHEEQELKPGATFIRLYVDPLVEHLEERNTFSPADGWTTRGVYGSDPEQTVALVIDLKSESHDTWPVVLAQLAPLRERGWLSHVRDGKVHYRPITVVGSGATDFETLTVNSTYRDTFFDAPLDALEDSPYDATNSYYASVSFAEHLGLSLTGYLTGSQMEKLRRAVAEARSRGLKARYWESPAWALNVRDRVWRTLSDEGVDIVNVDDLQSFRDWVAGRRPS